MNKHIAFTFFLVLSLVVNAKAQPPVSPDKWWEIQHNWDGITPWEKYMQLSAKYMGPNGMPVPEMNKAMVPENTTLELGFASHYGEGDRTKNAFFNTLIKFGDRAALGVYFVPYETYKMDTITSRYTRNTRDFDGEGTAVGDVYINSYFQILKEKKARPDLMLNVGIKTASGGNLEAARYTDAPGYYFSLSCGKTFMFNKTYFKSLRPYVLGGGYMWQTYRSDYKQDDAILYGIGLTLEGKHIIVDDNLSGYTGYIKNGDQPIVNKTSVTSNFNTFVNARVLFQYGIRDYDYKSIMLSTIFNLNKLNIGKHTKAAKGS